MTGNAGPVAVLPGLLPAGPVELRRWRERDVDELVKAVVASLAELRPWMEWAQEPPRREGYVDFVRQMTAAFDAGTDFVYGMYEPPSAEVVGGCGLHLRGGGENAEIGYWVRTDRHRRGYATAAAGALTAAGFTHLGDLRTVYIRVNAANTASAGVARKLGYVQHGASEPVRVAMSDLPDGMLWVMQRHDWAQAAQATVASDKFEH